MSRGVSGPVLVSSFSSDVMFPDVSSDEDKPRSAMFVAGDWIWVP